MNQACICGIPLSKEPPLPVAKWSDYRCSCCQSMRDSVRRPWFMKAIADENKIYFTKVHEDSARAKGESL
jgi:hypothetical protein